MEKIIVKRTEPLVITVTQKGNYYETIVNVEFGCLKRGTLVLTNSYYGSNASVKMFTLEGSDQKFNDFKTFELLGFQVDASELLSEFEAEVVKREEIRKEQENFYAKKAYFDHPILTDLAPHLRSLGWEVADPPDVDINYKNNSPWINISKDNIKIIVTSHAYGLPYAVYLADVYGPDRAEKKFKKYDQKKWTEAIESCYKIATRRRDEKIQSELQNDRELGVIKDAVAKVETPLTLIVQKKTESLPRGGGGYGNNRNRTYYENTYYNVAKDVGEPDKQTVISRIQVRIKEDAPMFHIPGLSPIDEKQLIALLTIFK